MPSTTSPLVLPAVYTLSDVLSAVRRPCDVVHGDCTACPTLFVASLRRGLPLMRPAELEGDSELWATLHWKDDA